MSRAIDPELQQIMEARYGEEVRGSIVTALEKTYDIGAAAIDDTTTSLTKVWSSQKVNTELGTKIPSSQKGAANGVATLDAQGKLPASQLPAVADDDIFEYASRSAFPATGVAAKIYVAKDTGFLYTWNGTAYVTLVDDSSAATNKVWSASKVSGELTEMEGSLTEDIEELEEDLNAEISRLDGVKAESDNLYAYKEAVPGEVVEVYDAVAEAVKQMQIEIAPVQDLHGYDHPWVGGAGKNLFNFPELNVQQAGGVTLTKNDDESFTLSGTANSTAFLANAILNVPIPANTAVTFSLNNQVASSEAGVRLVRGEPGSVTLYGTQVYANSVNKTGTVTETFEATHVQIFVKTNHGAVPAITFKLQCELGDTATAWSPYKNICPISGFTEANVVVNLLDYRKIFSDGEALKSNALTYKMTVPNGTYTLSTNIPLDGGYKSCFFTNKDESAQSAVNGVYDGHPRTITVTDGEVWIHVRTGNPGGGYIITEDSFRNGTYWICLREGTSAPIYTITFPSEAGTVYGGTLTVNADGTGTLVVDRAIKDIGSVNWSYSSSNTNFYTSEGGISGTAGNDSGIICSCYESKPYGSNGSYSSFDSVIFQHTDGTFRIRDSRYTDATAFKTALAGQKIVYFVTSTTIQLTAPQIRTILGYNRVYANTGSILSMLYPAERYQTAEQADRERIHAVVDEPSAVVSITDGADNVPMGMQIAIEPVQDTHGLTPYPPGGGTNILPMPITSGSYSNTVTVSVNSDLSFYITKTNGDGWTPFQLASSLLLTAGDYVLIESDDSSQNASLIIEKASDSSSIASTRFTKRVTFTLAEDTSVNIRFSRSATASNVLTKLMLFKGTTQTADDYAPYSNICPITGWTGAEISRTGKNLATTEIEKKGWIITANGETSSSAERYFISKPIEIKPGLDYYESYRAVSGSDNLRIGYYDKDLQFISRQASASGMKLVIPENAKYMKYSAKWNEPDHVDIQIEIGSVTAYEPYFGQTYPITFPSSAGTVYGGTLTINKDGTGELVVDMILHDNLKARTWTMETTSNGNVFSCNAISGKARNSNYICNKYKAVAKTRTAVLNGEIGTYNTSNAMNRFSICDNAYSTVADFVASLDDLEACYEINDHQTYTIPASVIRSLLGTNNIWSNTGKVLSLDYTQDTKSYIDNLFASLTNATGVSF